MTFWMGGSQQMRDKIFNMRMQQSELDHWKKMARLHNLKLTELVREAMEDYELRGPAKKKKILIK